MHDIFYFTDIHGCYNLFDAIMDYCKQEDPDANIIFGGDACDRGPEGYRIMRELLDDPHVGYIKGNHEDMFVRAADFIRRDYDMKINEDDIDYYLYRAQISDCYSYEIQDCLGNGGKQTLKDWILDGMPKDILDKLARLPLTFSYENLDFCHAGGNYRTFLTVADAEYNEDWPDKDDEELLIWDRNYIGQGWAPNRTCIFGHTPTIYLPSKYYGKDKSIENIHPCSYFGNLDNKWVGRKIDMDTGAFKSGISYVLNCLTMKAIGFRECNGIVEKFDMVQF